MEKEITKIVEKTIRQINDDVNRIKIKNGEAIINLKNIRETLQASIEDGINLISHLKQESYTASQIEQEGYVRGLKEALALFEDFDIDKLISVK